MRTAVATVKRLLVWATLLFVAYEVLEASPVEGELIAGGIIAVVAAIAVTWLYVVSETRYSARWSDLWRLSGVPNDVARDTLTVGAAIVRSLVDRNAMKGTVEQIPMEFGAEHGSYAATRRALVTFGTCIAPNTIVCLIDDRGLFVHRLVGPAKPHADRRWPL